MDELTARLDLRDPFGQQIVSINKHPFTIGRRISSDLRLTAPDVSKDHAEIEYVDDHFVLRDRGSRYGTFVNGERITERFCCIRTA